MSWMSIAFKALAIVVGLSSVGAGVYYFYQDWKGTNQRIGQMEQTLDQYKQTIKDQQDTLAGYQQRIEQTNNLQNRLNQRLSEIRSETSELKKQLAKHNLLELASKKPKLVEKKVNQATRETFAEFEEITDPKSYGGLK